MVSGSAPFAVCMDANLEQSVHFDNPSVGGRSSGIPPGLTWRAGRRPPASSLCSNRAGWERGGARGGPAAVARPGTGRAAVPPSGAVLQREATVPRRRRAFQARLLPRDRIRRRGRSASARASLGFSALRAPVSSTDVSGAAAARAPSTASATRRTVLRSRYASSRCVRPQYRRRRPVGGWTIEAPHHSQTCRRSAPRGSPSLTFSPTPIRGGTTLPTVSAGKGPIPPGNRALIPTDNAAPTSDKRCYSCAASIRRSGCELDRIRMMCGCFTPASRAAWCPV